MDTFELITIALLALVVLQVSYVIWRLPERLFRRSQTSSILLDTSVLIDGRIVSIAKTGFMYGELIVPRSVLGELQYMADGSDHDKRERARYGLDVVSELQDIPSTTVTILQDGSRADEGVDDRLISLAKKSGSAICTLDYNLNKVALVEGVTVLNINELAQSLRMAHLPGERVLIELVQKGQDGHQAVGYLPDGTMVVVERASQLVGKAVEVEVVRSLQTAAGRMMFAKQAATNATTKKSAVKQSAQNSSSGRQQNKNASRGRRPSPNKKRVAAKDPESTLIDLANKS